MIPIEEDTAGTMREIANYISLMCGPDYAFSVLITAFGAPGSTANYISNARRGDMIATLREKLDVMEAGTDMPGGVTN